jgi:phosphopantothenoylcysteine decarboxylase / phosphopantothenate---cysteine ligase
MNLKEITGTQGNELAGKKIVLCVTASISITEAPRIARLLMRHGAEVIPVLTPRACEFVSPMIFEWSTGNKPITKLTGRVEHVELVSPQSSSRADLILIAPCTANTIGRISSGIADEPVSTLICTTLGSSIPILIADAMHEPMLRNPIIEEAKDKLEKLGVKFISGKLTEFKSKLAEPEEILQAVITEIGKPQDRKKEENRNKFTSLGKVSGKEGLEGHGLVITAGPTREPIDDVRFISNPSTGKMGIALAEEALSKGASRVCLVYGPGVVLPDNFKNLINQGRIFVDSVVTSQEMLNSVLSELSKRGQYDVLVSAGAPADYTNLSPSLGKISTSEEPTLTIELTSTKKIIRVAKESHPEIFVVAFKAEHGMSPRELSLKAMETLRASGADMVVANDVGRTDIGFASDFNEVVVLTKGGRSHSLPKASKDEIASEILDIVSGELDHHP